MNEIQQTLTFRMIQSQALSDNDTRIPQSQRLHERMRNKY